ncbi:MAG TPA: nucleoside-diphosphate sugar epimerase/dehydratase, partial [Thermoanaerobaculia bacterium]|nr:nucleoside-diphosphate sugar epimerase/dehydratase [Thermoanaerobaculia bacterium]
MSISDLPARFLTRRERIALADFGVLVGLFAIDGLILGEAFALAHLLRFDFAVPMDQAQYAFPRFAYLVLVQLAALAIAGAYDVVWRYIGIRDMKPFLVAGITSGAVLAAVRLALPQDLDRWRVPLSITLMQTMLGFAGVVALRVLRRVLFEAEEKQRLAASARAPARQVPTLFVGAGHVGVLAAREVVGRPDADLDVRGFVDDDPDKQGLLIYGLRVLGTTRELPRLVREHGIQQVALTVAKIERRDIRRVVDICEKIPVKVRIVPSLSEILDGKVNVSRIRDVAIEDLLGRTPVQLDEKSVGQFLQGRMVMVTGAGGSIGSELARQVARFRPSCILLVDRAEFVLFDIEQELLARFRDVPIVPLVGDVGDESRMRTIFGEYRPEVVFHAAAHKHVPMMERHPCEAIKNNVLGTKRLGEIAGFYGAEAFVLVSTDKAVHPTSVMGASKRVAELVVQDLTKRHATRYVAVRFGNVIGSAGSVVKTFREQIERGGPVTVTHPDMRRYFMTIPEAAQLVLQAGAMGQGGEIYVLDMGKPVRILDLAIGMITLSGLKPFDDVPIVFTGLRPGEKLFEELELSGEEFATTRHPKIFIGRLGAYPGPVIRTATLELERLAEAGEADGIRAAL